MTTSSSTSTTLKGKLLESKSWPSRRPTTPRPSSPTRRRFRRSTSNAIIDAFEAHTAMSKQALELGARAGGPEGRAAGAWAALREPAGKSGARGRTLEAELRLSNPYSGSHDPKGALGGLADRVPGGGTTLTFRRWTGSVASDSTHPKNAHGAIGLKCLSQLALLWQIRRL